MSRYKTTDKKKKNSLIHAYDNTTKIILWALYYILPGSLLKKKFKAIPHILCMKQCHMLKYSIFIRNGRQIFINNSFENWPPH